MLANDGDVLAREAHDVPVHLAPKASAVEFADIRVDGPARKHAVGHSRTQDPGRGRAGLAAIQRAASAEQAQGATARPPPPPLPPAGADTPPTLRDAAAAETPPTDGAPKALAATRPCAGGCGRPMAPADTLCANLVKSGRSALAGG